MIKLILVLTVFCQFLHSQVDSSYQFINQLDTVVFSNRTQVVDVDDTRKLNCESESKFIFTSDGVKGIEVVFSKHVDSLILLKAGVHDNSMNMMYNSTMFFDFQDGTRIELQNEYPEVKSNTTEFLVHLHYRSVLIKNLIENKLTRMVLFYSDGVVNEFIPKEQANLLANSIIRMMN